MRTKAKYTEVNPLHGVTRLKRMFAWLPVYIDGDKLWFETYEILQMYHQTEHKAILDPKKPTETTSFVTGQWIDISKRIMK